jgi:hypothetical protein
MSEWVWSRDVRRRRRWGYLTNQSILLDGGWQTLRVAGAAQHNRPFPWLDRLHRAEGEGAPPPREEAVAADDDLVRVVSVPLVADVIEPADVRAVALEHAIALGGGVEAAEFSQCPTAPLAARVRATLLHGEKSSDGKGRRSSQAVHRTSTISC